MTQTPPSSSARSRILTKVARRPLRRVRIGADELPQRARLHRQRRELTAETIINIPAKPAPFLLAPDRQPLPRAQQGGGELHAVGCHANLASEVVEQPP